ncbi:MAG: ABC transporter ATP-binding protein [Bacillales bacterium]
MHKANNQINENLSTIKEYKSLLTKLENNDANKEELISKKEVLEDKVNSYLSLVVRNYGFDKETYLAKIDKANSKIEKLNKSKEPTTDNIPLELRKERYNLQINDYNAHIELLDKFIIKKFTSNLIDNLTIVNEYLSLLIELTKKGLKNQSPVLKKIFRLSKKNANNIVAFHKLQLLKEHKTKSLELKQKLFHAQKDLLDYKNSLSIEKRNELNSIVRKNKLIKKQIKKEQVTFKENSISKTVQNNLKLVEFSDKKFEKLFLKVEECKNALEDEKNNYINKTRITKKEAKKKALEVMREVGIPLPERRFNQYPFEFSGGMRQRIVIAIALTADPEILICDEPTTALDVTIQAQILELINRLKVERNLSCIFITHDLGVVANMADRVAVMYAGKIVEYGLVEEVFFEPKHPYTWALLSSIPDIDSKEKLEAIPGTPPDMVYPPKGDAFALRSKYALKIDFKYEPPYFEVSPTHYAATWLLHKDAPKVEMPKIVKTRIKNAYKQYEESLKGGK